MPLKKSLSRRRRPVSKGKRATHKRGQSGGSAASDRVVRFANEGAASLEDYKHKAGLPGLDDVKSMPVLYQTAGGKKKRSVKSRRKSGRKTKRVSKKTKRGRRSHTKKAKRTGRQRGAGFLNMAGCGPVNAPDAGRKYAHLFTKSSMCPGPDFYRNPPGLEKAGSGNGAVAGPGAPFPFK